MFPLLSSTPNGRAAFLKRLDFVVLLVTSILPYAMLACGLIWALANQIDLSRRGSD
jgi:hypothetical protein